MPLKRKKLTQSLLDSEDLFDEIESPVKKKSQKTTPRKKQKESVFAKLVTNAGLILKTGDRPNVLECDQAVFRRSLQKGILVESSYGQNEDFYAIFVKGLDDHIENRERLKWALLYTQTDPGCDSVRSNQQDSLIRLLLNFDELQPKIIELLIEKLLEIAYDDETDISKANIPNLILANLRWLDHIADSESLTSKIADLLVGAPLKLQREIISFVPNILDDAGHCQIADSLLELFESTPELTAPILDTLPYLTLPPGKLDGIHHQILKSLEEAKGENLPIIIKFLLHNTQQTTAVATLRDIRDLVNLPHSDGNTGNSSQYFPSQNAAEKTDSSDRDVLLFSGIKWAILSKKFLATAWLKAIDEETDSKNIKSFDLIVLFLLYDCFPARRKAIESILRNKIRLGVQADTVLKNTFIHHSSVLDIYFESIRKIAGVLARAIEPSFHYFGFRMYKYTFLYLKFSQPEIVFSLLSHLIDNEVTRGCALNLISDLTFNYTSDMAKYIRPLQGAIDVIHVMSLREAKKLMNAIIYLVHNSSSQSALQDELNIMVHKQLAHQDIKYKRLGVLCAVLTIKTIFAMDDNNSSSSDYGITPLREAESIFEMVHSLAKDSPECTALFMDELASSILRDGLHSELEKWISNKVITDFEDNFVMDVTDLKDINTKIPASIQWNLDTLQTDTEEDNKPIAIKLTLLALQTKQEGNGTSIITMGPHFRLLRMVESHLHDGNLDNIDALLGCAILAPSEHLFTKFSSLSDDEKTYSLTCLFHIINWFREVINAFATQKDKEMRLKVFDRLREVIKLQTVLCSILPHHPSFVPPPAVFDLDLDSPISSILSSASNTKTTKKTTQNKKSKGKKRKITEDTISSSAPDCSTFPESQMVNQQEETSVQLSHSAMRPFFRELHLDVFNLLYRQLQLDDELEGSGFLTLPEAEFLLTDLNLKLAHVLEGTKKASFLGKSIAEKDIGFAHLDLFSSSEIAKQTYRFVKPICVHLETISKFFQSIIADSDGLEDGSNMYTEKTRPIMEVQTRLFTSLKLYLSIPSVQTNENGTLKEILHIIAKNIEGNAVADMNLDELLAASFRYMNNFKDTVCTISSAVSLIQVLECLQSIEQDSTSMKLTIYETLQQLLKKEWKTPYGLDEKGSAYNQHIRFLLVALFSYSPDPVDLAYEISVHGIRNLTSKEDLDESEIVFSSLTKSTLGVYYKCVMENLVASVTSSLRQHDDAPKKLEIWHLAIKSFVILVSTLKVSYNNMMIGTCLKNSKGFLELFLRQGMPLFDKCLKSDQHDIISLIKNLQASTRFVQHVCTHSKVKQDVTLIRYVPSVKKCLETIIYRVKAMLVVNKCTGAFWLGNLKNRDLKGEEILSQEVVDDDSNADEENAPEDEQSDVDLDDDEDEDKSNSSKENGTDYSDAF